MFSRSFERFVVVRIGFGTKQLIDVNARVGVSKGGAQVALGVDVVGVVGLEGGVDVGRSGNVVFKGVSDKC